MKKPNSGQSVSEYFIIMTVITAVIIASGFLGKIKSTFDVYFDKAASAISTGRG